MHAIEQATLGQRIKLATDFRLDTPIHIRKAVYLVGVRLDDGRRPTIDGQIIVDGGDLTIEGIDLRSFAVGPALQVNDGLVSVSDSSVAISYAPGGRSPRGDLAALFVQGGTVRIDRTSIGPGYSQAATVGGGSLHISNSRILNPDYLAMFVYGGSISVSSSTISGRRGLELRNSPQIDFTSNTFDTEPDQFAIKLIGRPSGAMITNFFQNGTNANWLCVTRSSTANNVLSLRANRQSDGTPFSSLVTKTSC